MMLSMSNKLAAALNNRPWLLADGASGTNLFQKGLKQGDPPEIWNLEQPEKILELHRDFIDSGADIILTNSFGGTRNRLKLHKGLDEQCFELNKIAAELAHQAIKESNRDEVIVAGSMGPTGDLYEPIGPLSIEDGAKAYAEQAQGLEAGGADVLWIETLSSMEEVEAALTGAATTNLPSVVTASFDSSGRTMMGLTPAQFADSIRVMPHAPMAFGANCGNGTSDLSAAILSIANQKQGDILIAKSNAGVPEYKGGEFVYSGTIEHMANYACIARDLGARIIGGCCGTSPEHLAAMHEALTNTEAKTPLTIQEIAATLGPLSSPQEANPGDHRSSRRRSRRSE